MNHFEYGEQDADYLWKDRHRMIGELIKPYADKSFFTMAEKALKRAALQ